VHFVGLFFVFSSSSIVCTLEYTSLVHLTSFCYNLTLLTIFFHGLKVTSHAKRRSRLRRRARGGAHTSYCRKLKFPINARSSLC